MGVFFPRRQLPIEPLTPPSRLPAWGSRRGRRDHRLVKGDGSSRPEVPSTDKDPSQDSVAFTAPIPRPPQVNRLSA